MDTQRRAVAGGGQVQRMDQRIELGQLPVVRVESGYKVAGVLLGLVGALMALGALGILYGEFSPWGLLTPLTWTGIAILLGGVHLAIMGKEVTLDGERVSVRTRGLLGGKSWTEPLAAYRGALLRSKWVSGGQNSRSVQVFLVELLHTDAKKTVAVFESRREKGWHAAWRAVSIRFRLVALEETAGGVVAHTPEDLETPVRDKVEAGALEVAFDPSAAPPAGLVVQAVAGGLDIRVVSRNWRSPALWSAVALVLSGLVLATVLLAWTVPAQIAGGVLAGFGLAAVALLAGFLLSRPRLRVGRDAVVASWMTPLGEMRKQRVDPAQIHGVQIGAPKGQQGGACLHVMTEEDRIYFGAGLSMAALEWLRNCLLAAVARL